MRGTRLASGRLDFARLPSAERAIIEDVRLELSPTASRPAAPATAALPADRLVATAEAHRILPLLYGVLGRNDLLDRMPGEARSHMKAAYRSSAMRALGAQAELARVLGATRSAGVEPILMRGLALGEDLYHDVAERPFRDIDLLLREEAWPKFREAMLGLGYRAGQNDAPTLPKRMLPQVGLDHLFEFSGPRGHVECKFDPLELGLTMRGLDRLWAKRRRLEVAGAAATRLAPEHELLALCVHLNRHGYQQLIWLVDIALYLRRYGAGLDWDETIRCARTEGVLPSLHYTLGLAESLFGSVLPDAVLADTRPSLVAGAVWRSTWREADLLEFCAPHEATLVFRKRLTCRWLPGNLLMTGRLREKLGYFLRRGFPPREVLEARYGSPFVREPYWRILARRYGDAIAGKQRVRA